MYPPSELAELSSSEEETTSPKLVSFVGFSLNSSTTGFKRRPLCMISHISNPKRNDDQGQLFLSLSCSLNGMTQPHYISLKSFGWTEEHFIHLDHSQQNLRCV